MRKHPQVPKFFRSTWIPDESFFQTVIAKVIPRREIADLQLMFHHLGLSGRPYVFYNDHLELVNKLPHFFIRKVSPSAGDLIKGLVESPRPRPLPRPKHLAHVRDLLRARIDASHWFGEHTPGHLELKPVLVKKIESIPGPIVVLLVSGDGDIPELEGITAGNPACYWLGRPFAPRWVRMPADGLVRMGMSEQSWQLRDTFLKDFISRLASCSPDNRVPVLSIVLKEDDQGLAALALAREVVLLAVSRHAHKPHRFSLVAGALEAVHPGLAARVAHVEPSDVAGILDDFVRSADR
ncbi:MAG: hypothetical protein EOP85_04845 [Verrucomicrobiaceae bacterium]|nr:MAG: hypothetical protein EOP85_04845 [Verrucomicrobiaceae bacterium]